MERNYGRNGYLYGIPAFARRVGKFNPVDKSLTLIGPDLGRGCKWIEGAITDGGVIYCVPDHSRVNGILKIETNTDTVTELDGNLIPERAHNNHVSCATALDGCIYFMPSRARRNMKLDPNDNDAMTSVGDDLGNDCWKYSGTVVGIDGCVYGIPNWSKRIVRYDPINDTASIVGEDNDKFFKCEANGALGRDGCIYALTEHGQVLKIDTVNNSHSFVRNSIQSEYDHDGWGDPILGIDGCIYWPPCRAKRALKYDPHSNQISLVGDDFGDQWHKWFGGGALATDGVICCIPSSHSHVLAIDPLGEFVATTKANIHKHPEEFGSLFQTIEVDEDSLFLSLTNFDHAVIKFGPRKVFEVLENSMKPINDFCKESNLCPFMIAASFKESTVCAINHLLRRDLSWVNSRISSLDNNTPKKKKMKMKITYNSVRYDKQPKSFVKDEPSILSVRRIQTRYCKSAQID